MLMNKGRGRPRGGSDARERILRAARARFGADGYADATMRAIAADADVDVALLSYHFGSKHGLFVAAMSVALSPSDIVAGALDGPVDRLAARILAAVMNSWEDAERAAQMRTFIVTALQHEEILAAFREYLEREVIARTAERLGGPDATNRVTAAVTIAVGLVFSRYVVGLAPAAAMSARQMHAALTPATAVALTGQRVPQVTAGGSQPRRPGPT